MIVRLPLAYGGIATVLGLLRVTSLAAQVAYTVLPVAVSDSSVKTVGNSAQPIKRGPKAKVTLNVKDQTVEDAMNALLHQVGLEALYNNKNPAFAKRITLRLENVNVMDALAVVLKGTGLVAKLTPDEETVMIRPQVAGTLSDKARAADGTITGRVTDSASGRGLTGATVKVQGLNMSAITTDSGAFTLRKVPAGEHLLTARLFGYRVASHAVTVVENERATVRIVLAPVLTVLSGVVTTVTGTQRRAEIGNDITSINVDSVMKTAPITSITDVLEARVPGLQVLHTSGTPGAPARIRIRGTSSINGNNDPIVVVDGIRVFAAQSDKKFGSTSLAQSDAAGSTSQEYATPSPLDQIDPNNVATIEVYKGPSATAMYGSDAANGVIVITTKRGRIGPAHWTLAANQGFSYMPGAYSQVYRAFGHYFTGGALTSTTLCENWNTVGGIENNQVCRQDSVVSFQALNERALTVLGRGTDTRASLGVTGGTETFTYGFTMSGAGTQGLLKLPDIEAERYQKFQGVAAPGWMRRPDTYQTWSGSGNIRTQLTPTAWLAVTSTLFNSTQQQSSLQSAIGQLANAYIDTTTLDSVSLVNDFYERHTAQSLTSNTAANVEWNGISWLPISAVVGLNITNRTDKALTPRGLAARAASRDSAGFFSIGRGTTTDKTLQIKSTHIPLGPWVTGSIGADLNNVTNATVGASTYGIPVGASEPTSFGCPANAASTEFCGTGTQATSAATTYGWFVMPQLNVHSRFFATPGFRLDGGTASGANAGFTPFPKLDVSWIAIDRQSSPPLFGVLSLLRPRLAFGIAGVQPGPADRLRLLQQTLTTLDAGTTQADQLLVTSFGNTHLRPERSRELEGGVDTELWQNRVSIIVTGYHKLRQDAIVELPIAKSVYGGGRALVNIGQVLNTGLELSLNTQVVEQARFGWNVGLHFSSNHNRVLRLNAEQGPIHLPEGDATPGIQTRIVPGYPINSQWARPIIAYADRNHDGIIDPFNGELLVGDSLVYVGQEDPNYQLALTTNMVLGRLSFSATADYVRGMTQLNASEQGMSQALYDPNAPLAEQAVVSAFHLAKRSANSPYSTAYGLLQVVNVFRINAMSFSYAMPPTVAHRFRAQSMSLALQGSNLGLFTNYRGKDPNVNAFATGNLTSDNGQLPQPRTWSLALTIGF